MVPVMGLAKGLNGEDSVRAFWKVASTGVKFA
jgi:hypothetical protein